MGSLLPTCISQPGLWKGQGKCFSEEKEFSVDLELKCVRSSTEWKVESIMKNKELFPQFPQGHSVTYSFKEEPVISETCKWNTDGDIWKGEFVSIEEDDRYASTLEGPENLKGGLLLNRVADQEYEGKVIDLKDFSSGSYEEKVVWRFELKKVQPEG